MQSIEAALIDVIDSYGYRTGKYKNLAVDQSQLSRIIKRFAMTGTVDVTKKHYSRSVELKLFDGSRVWIGALGELSWRLVFTASNRDLDDCVEGGFYHQRKKS